MQPIRVLFVCDGNVCRSPLAAALLRNHADPGTVASIASAGLIAEPDDRPNRWTLDVARARGVELDGHRPRRFVAADLDDADLVLVMEERQRLAVGAQVPASRRPPDTRLLTSFGGGRAHDIADPGEAHPHVYVGYQRCVATIEAAVCRLARWLRA